MFLKIAPFILPIIAIGALILGASGEIGDTVASVILALVIVCSIAVGVCRSRSARAAERSDIGW
jgi:hypothetical protein